MNFATEQVMLPLICLLGLACTEGCTTVDPKSELTASTTAMPASQQLDGAAAKPVHLVEETVQVDTTATGEKLHCEQVATTGTRLVRTRCVTAEQRRKEQENARAFFEQARNGY